MEALPADGLAFLNADDGRVAAMGKALGKRTVLYGLAPSAQVRAEDVAENGSEGVTFTALADGERAPVALKLMGRHNVHNALAAIAVGLASGMALAECAAAVGMLQAGDKRGVVTVGHGARCSNDCYNSNPVALDAMVDALLAMPVGAGGRHIVVAGEMLELGPEGEALHRACGARMAARGVDFVVGVRGLAQALVAGFGGEGTFVETPAAAGAWMLGHVRAGDAVLLKASRGVRLEGALDALHAHT